LDADTDTAFESPQSSACGEFPCKYLYALSPLFSKYSPQINFSFSSALATALPHNPAEKIEIQLKTPLHDCFCGFSND
jgi:hypothetical protein